MGREIRRVPPNWEHPQRTKYDPFKRVEVTSYQPLFDQDVESAWAKWNADYLEWLATGHAEAIQKHPDVGYSKSEPYRDFCDWHGRPPNPEYYRPIWDEAEATCYQVYETVSEGTPVTPVFRTQEELVEYLVEHGDFWDQRRREEGGFMSCDPWTREQAEAFVYGSGWVPSLVADSKGLRSGREALPDMEGRK